LEANGGLEANAILLQFIAGDIQEMEDCFDSYEEYREAQEQGTASGYLYRTDDDRWIFDLGI
jgi:hypothetical protein